MDKPISMRIDELKESLSREINNSQLPYFIIEPVVTELARNIMTTSKKLAEQERENYLSYKKENIDEEN